MGLDCNGSERIHCFRQKLWPKCQPLAFSCKEEWRCKVVRKKSTQRNGDWYCPLAMPALTPTTAGAWVEGCPQHFQTLLCWIFFACLISLKVFNWFKAPIRVTQRANRFSIGILWIVAQPFTVAGKRGTRRFKKEIFKVSYLLVYRLSATSAWQVW